ncbi:unnamed protein product [Ixodes pacificus]
MISFWDDLLSCTCVINVLPRYELCCVGIVSLSCTWQSTLCLVYRQPLEGQLFKYTNVVKGWQYRWFVLNPDIGMFEYYMLDELKKGRPRGAVHLAGAVISPSDEDGQMFTVSAACGEVYKLRGHDAKERQFWINRLRKVAEDHTKTIAQVRAVSSEKGASAGPGHQGGSASAPVSQTVWYTTAVGAPTEATTTPAEAFTSVREILARAGRMYHCLARSIEVCWHVPSASLICRVPFRFRALQDMLVLKATSCATVMCLEQCLTILQEHKRDVLFGLGKGVGGSLGEGERLFWERRKEQGVLEARKKLKVSFLEWGKASARKRVTSSFWSVGKEREVSGSSFGSEKIQPETLKATSRAVVGANSSGEVSDGESGEEDESIPTEENKDSILQLLSKLKLGMDLTKAWHFYILEPRSLLEVYADFMSYPDLFVRIADGTTPEERLVRVVEWFLCSLYATRKASTASFLPRFLGLSHSARKPYNPVLGEMFRCSWQVPGMGDAGLQVTFVAEQVSHHPPVSAFYVECMEKKMCLEASLGVKSNLMGNYVGMQFLGEGRCLLDAKYLDSKTVLWRTPKGTLGSPLGYSGKLLWVHWKTPGGTLRSPCRYTGEPQGVLWGAPEGTLALWGTPEGTLGSPWVPGTHVLEDFGEWRLSDPSPRWHMQGNTREWPVREQHRQRKRCRPVDAQDTCESRRLWRPVTQALRSGDLMLASHHKFQIEERQRELTKGKETAETENGLQAQDAKLFRLEGNMWKYKYILSKGS